MRFLDPDVGTKFLNVPGPVGGNLPATVPLPAAPLVPGYSNLLATADPLTSNDTTQGYQVGSLWFNTTAGALRLWSCRDNTAGAAKWIFEGADYTNGGSNPSAEVTQFGSGIATMGEEGNVSRQIPQPSINPGGTGADYVLAVYIIPANSFDIAGRGVSITAQGSVGNNANTKTLKMIFNPSTATVGGTVGSGGTTIASLTVSGTAGAPGFILLANIYKYGAAGSNTQKALHESAQAGTTVGQLVAPSLLTATESSPITIAVTGNAATVVSDIGLDFLQVNAMN